MDSWAVDDQRCYFWFELFIWLVVWNMLWDEIWAIYIYGWGYIGNVIIPTDFHSIIFQRGRSTTNQLLNTGIFHCHACPPAGWCCRYLGTLPLKQQHSNEEGLAIPSKRHSCVVAPSPQKQHLYAQFCQNLGYFFDTVMLYTVYTATVWSYHHRIWDIHHRWRAMFISSCFTRHLRVVPTCILLWELDISIAFGWLCPISCPWHPWGPMLNIHHFTYSVCHDIPWCPA